MGGGKVPEDFDKACPKRSWKWVAEIISKPGQGNMCVVV